MAIEMIGGSQSMIAALMFVTLALAVAGTAMSGSVLSGALSADKAKSMIASGSIAIGDTYGLTTIRGAVTSGAQIVNGTSDINGNQTLTGNSTVTGNKTLVGATSALSVGGTSTLTGNVTMQGAATVATTLGVAGVTTLTGNAGPSAGTGITVTGAAIYVSSLFRTGSMIETQIFIDLTGLQCAANTAGGGSDVAIIGTDGGTTFCNFGQITAALNGTIIAGTMQCIVAPGTGETDIDLHTATSAAGAEAAAVSGLAGQTLLVQSTAAWTAGRILPLTAFPPANDFLYLARGGNNVGGDQTYIAGMFIITLYGR